MLRSLSRPPSSFRSHRGKRFHGGGSGGATHDGSTWWGWYMNQLDTNPFRTAAATSFLLYAAGDGTSQLLDGANTGIEWRRLAGTSVDGSLMGGVFGVFWYNNLDKFVGTTLNIRSGTFAFVGAKLAMEMLVYHPISLCAFWFTVGLSEGDSIEHIQSELRHDFFPTLRTEVAFWSPIDTLNFLFVPVHLQVIVINAACFLEAILLSYLRSHGGGEGHGGGYHGDSLEKRSRPIAVVDVLRETDLSLEMALEAAQRDFRRLDRNGDGFLTAEELQSAFQERGTLPGIYGSAASAKAAEILMRRAMQHDGNKISEAELLRFVSKFTEAKYRSGLLADVVFEMLDTDHSGQLEGQELEKVMSILYGNGTGTNNKMTLDAMMKQCDLNKDGKLSKAEFLSMLETKRK